MENIKLHWIILNKWYNKYVKWKYNKVDFIGLKGLKLFKKFFEDFLYAKNRNRLVLLKLILSFSVLVVCFLHIKVLFCFLGIDIT